MSFNEILNGIKSIFIPLIEGFSYVIKIFFDMPEVAGLSVGYWLLAFMALSIVFGGFFE